jgi:hypothetical protein
MSITNPSPTRAPFDQGRVRPPLPFFADYRRGNVQAITGQPATFTRAATATVAGQTGGSFTLPANRPALTWAVDALAYQQGNADILSYPYGAQTPAGLQVAWDGIVDAQGSDGVLWRIGDAAGSNGFVELRKLGGQQVLRATYADGSGNTSTADVYCPIGSRLYVVTRLEPSGANVQVRITIGTPTLAFATSGLGTARARVTAWSDNKIHIGSRNGTNPQSSRAYRVLAQPGTPGVERLPFGWDAGVGVLPSAFGLVSNGQISLEPSVTGTLFWADQGTHISIEASPSNFRAVSPLGLATPDIFLEAV